MYKRESRREKVKSVRKRERKRDSGVRERVAEWRVSVGTEST